MRVIHCMVLCPPGDPHAHARLDCAQNLTQPLALNPTAHPEDYKVWHAADDNLNSIVNEEKDYAAIQPED